MTIRKMMGGDARIPVLLHENVDDRTGHSLCITPKALIKMAQKCWLPQDEGLCWHAGTPTDGSL